MSNVIEFSIRALDDFSANMSKLQLTMSKAERAFASLGIAAAVYVGINAAKASLDNAEAMGTAAMKANMTTEAFSKLAWAAKMSNVETGSLATGLKFLGKAMAEGDASDAGKALNMLGVAARDAKGELRPIVDVLLDVSDKFAGAKDNAEKTAFAMKVFGRAGVDMIPLLNGNSDAMRELMDNAEKLGVVISDDFAKSADQINDNLETMGAVLRGSVNRAMQQLSPVIEQITGQFIELATAGDSIKKAGDVMASGLRLIMSAGIVVIGVFKTLGEYLGGVVAGLVQLAKGNFTEAFEALTASGTDMVANIKGMMADVNKVWDESAQSVAAAKAKEMAAMRAASQSLRDTTEEDKAARKQADEDAKMYAERAKQSALSGAAAFKDQMEQAIGIYHSLDSPMEQHRQKLMEIYNARELLMEGGRFEAALAEENNRWESARAAAEVYGVSVGSVARGIGDAMAQTVVDGASLAKGLENVAKSVLKTIIATYVQMQAQRLIMWLMDKAATTTSAAQKLGAGLSEVYVNSFASAAAIPMYGWAMAPGIAAANAAVAASGAATSMAAGAALGGAAHGGMDYVPRETTYLLDRGERVLSPNQNQDLTSFLNGGNGGGLSVQNLTIHVLENATNTDAFRGMDKMQLRYAIGQPIVDALDEMFKLGIKPAFANVKR